MKSNPALAVGLIAALGLQVLIFSGCSSAYTRTPGSQPATAMKTSVDHPIADVSIDLTPQVKEKLKDSLKFDQQAFSKTVELALSNRQLLNKEKKETGSALQITVTYVRVRNTFNAMMWGAMSGNDSIKGDVVVKDTDGAVVDQFHVDTSYALGAGEAAKIP